ncbi:hypothetical protein E2542_SST23327 [Spatholobus suberectus]|nr:hypothetical protein E2542_SST23327 [Spatholobus suberectus]
MFSNIAATSRQKEMSLQQQCETAEERNMEENKDDHCHLLMPCLSMTPEYSMIGSSRIVQDYFITKLEYPSGDSLTSCHPGDLAAFKSYK